ncbi:restriction endonuclease subunit S [Bacillus cereus group sp. Sample62]|uniref:restriction endonuclease subunit S n=1 Tax=Bacillus cereus group TaxID=86661 RepID=UPI00086C0EA8|nr:MULTISPECIES: restriction endonuclease subunit S [Bacillus cereus group]SCN31311.1 Type I restriction enzyme, S subunit [Bacillus cereus]HDR4726443.1 restriction endonuclease subunit S [Bacillus cereus]HDX9549887.1 restriction endonuclease subunit S [Bacillus thuringiensis]
MSKIKATKGKEIPEGWEYVKIEDVFQAIDGDRGKNYPNENDFLSNGHCLFLDTKNVTKKGFSFKKRKFISNEKDNSLRNGKLVRNDIVMTSRGTIGNISLYDESVPFKNVRINSAMLILRPKNEGICNKYWIQLLRGKVLEEFIRKVKVGSAQPHITKKSLNSLKVLIPKCIEEQQKIAHILTSVDDAIEKTEAIIEQTEEVKKGLMQQLFTRGVGHTKFKKTEIGEIPEEWEVHELGEVTSITRLAGAEYSDLWETRENGEIISLRGFNIGNNELVRLEEVERISESLSERLIRSKLFEGDVVFPCVGTIGKAAVIREANKYHINQNIAKITGHDKLEPDYIAYFLMSDITLKQIIKYNTSSSQPNVLVGNLRKFVISTPPLEEQRKIVDIFINVDKKIKNEHQKHEQFKQVKAGLMQSLLTGKIRVKVDEPEVKQV